MPYQIQIKKSAFKELSKLPNTIFVSISDKINTLDKNPFPSGYKKLKGSKNYYRLRVGNYRIVYSVYQDVLIIEIIRIRHRKNVYK